MKVVFPEPEYPVTGMSFTKNPRESTAQDEMNPSEPIAERETLTFGPAKGEQRMYIPSCGK
jgi:hypothetical protein